MLHRQWRGCSARPEVSRVQDTGFAVLAEPSISDVVLVEEAGQVGLYAARLVWFVAPFALIAAASHAVERRSVLALSFTLGTLLGWSRLVSFTMLPVVGSFGMLGWGALLIPLMVVTPVPFIAFATASSFLVAGVTLVAGPTGYLAHLVFLWIAALGVGLVLLRANWRLPATLRS